MMVYFRLYRQLTIFVPRQIALVSNFLTNETDTNNFKTFRVQWKVGSLLSSLHNAVQSYDPYHMVSYRSFGLFILVFRTAIIHQQIVAMWRGSSTIVVLLKSKVYVVSLFVFYTSAMYVRYICTYWNQCCLKQEQRSYFLGIVNTYSMKQPGLYCFETIKMTSQT